VDGGPLPPAIEPPPLAAASQRHMGRRGEERERCERCFGSFL
jgi:hypothetical protein